MTTIQDTVTYIDGRMANGKIILTWPILQVGGVAIAAGQDEWPVVDGQVSITVYPNINAQPLGVYYTATYELDEGAVYDEFWIVPDATTVTIATVRAQFPTTPSVMINAMQLTSSGAAPGMILGWNGTSWVPMFISDYNAPVQKVFGRTGQISAQTGDYSVEQVTGAVGVTRRINTVLPLQGGGDLSQDLTLSVNAADVVPGTRQVIAGFGLTGGGPLTSDVTLAVATSQLAGVGLQSNADGTLSVVPETTAQLVQVALAGTVQGTQPQLNFLSTPGANFNVVNVPGSNRVDVSVSLTGTGPASPSIFSVNGAAIGTQPELNLIAGSGTTITGVDDTGLNRVDVTIQASAVGGVSSFNTRTGAVLPAAGDYTAALVTNAVDTTQSYANPSWITSLPWGKITGAPAGASFWQGGSGGAIYYNGGPVGIGTSTPVTTLHLYAASPNALTTPLVLENTDAANGSGNQEVALQFRVGRPSAYRLLNIKTVSSADSFNNQTGLAFEIVINTGSAISTTEAMRLTQVNGLPAAGIGTSAPARSLVVVGSSTPVNSNSILMRGYQAAFEVLNAAGNQNYYFGVDDADSNKLKIGIGQGAEQALTPTITMTPGQPGNVGIGTTNPAFRLHSAGAIAADQGGSQYVTLGTNVGGSSSPTTWAGMWYDAGTNTLQIAVLSGGVAWRNIALAAPGGIVGIGTSSPGANLDIQRGSGDSNDILRVGSNQGWYFGFARSNSTGALSIQGNQSGANNIVLAPTSGNVGVGTTTPGMMLDVAGIIRSTSPAGAGGIGAGLELYGSSGNGGVQAYDRGAGHYTQLNIDSSLLLLNAVSHGSVGIGTTSPSYTCQVTGSFGVITNTNTLARSLFLNQNTQGAARCDIQIGAGSNNMYLGTQMTPGAYGWGEYSYIDSPGPLLLTASSIVTAGRMGVGITCNPVGSLMVRTGANIDLLFGSNGGVFSLQSLNDGADTYIPLSLYSSYLHIYSTLKIETGSLVFADGTTQSTAAVSGGATTTITWQTNGTSVFTSSGNSTILNFTGSGQASVGYGVAGNQLTYTIFSSSDERAKQHIEPLVGGLASIAQIRPVHAEWNGALGKTKGDPLAGVIAQEIAEVLPEAVYTVRIKLHPEDEEETDVLGLEPMAIVAHLILAVQQLKAKVEKLEKRRN